MKKAELSVSGEDDRAVPKAVVGSYSLGEVDLSVHLGYLFRFHFIPSCTKNMAERVGFEPTIPVKVCPLSRRIVSTTHAPLRKLVGSGQLPVEALSPRLAVSSCSSRTTNRRRPIANDASEKTLASFPLNVLPVPRPGSPSDDSDWGDSPPAEPNGRHLPSGHRHRIPSGGGGHELPLPRTSRTVQL